MTRELIQTLAMVAEATADAAHPRWIIGSAAVVLHGGAVVLHGGAVVRVRDLDLMMSAADAERLLRRVGGELRDSGSSDRFRSAIFGAHGCWSGGCKNVVSPEGAKAQRRKGAKG